MSGTFESGIKKRKNYLNSHLIACDLLFLGIFLPTELFRLVLSCKIVNSSMKFKVIHKISVMQEKFLVFFHQFQGPDITRSGAGYSAQAAGSASLVQLPTESKQWRRKRFEIGLI